tara:strand:+ start:62610 stop:63983 length:1374 start_codon:yes stop_codon:yes gene_type:complete
MINKLWANYQQWYIDYIGFSNRSESEGLLYFRDKLFVSILLVTVVLGVFSYVPSVVASIVLDKLFVLYIDSLAIFVMLFILFNKNMGLERKKFLFSANLFLLSFALTLYLGFDGNGSILLFVLNILITLYSGRKAGLISVYITALFYALVLISFYFELFDLPIFKQVQFEVMCIVFINNILFSLLIVFSISFLIYHLHRALLKENELQLELKEKHENVLEAKQKAEKSDRLKSAFLANMSHEIRTPMYGILGCAEFLKAYNKNDKEYQEYVGIIETNGNELSVVISDILNVSKIETGLVGIQVKTFNVNENINEVYDTFLSQTEEKDIHFIQKNTVTANDAIINSDSDKLTAILKYLVKNAIKYTENGTIEIGCAHLDDHFLEFYIKDTGIGIPKDDFEAIFQPFYQVDIQNKKALHGAGLGLTIAKAYIEILGGGIRVKSKEGIGTTFWFTIATHL